MYLYVRAMSIISIDQEYLSDRNVVDRMWIELLSLTCYIYRTKCNVERAMTHFVNFLHIFSQVGSNAIHEYSLFNMPQTNPPPKGKKNISHQETRKSDDI